MKTLYLECNMGAAGDMLAGALLELVPDPGALLKKMNALGLPGVVVSRAMVEQCGVRGSHVSVWVKGEEEQPNAAHHHEVRKDGDMKRIEKIVEGFRVSEKVKADILAVYGMIAQAEAEVHGVPAGEIHFHELGTMDALADITAACLLMEEIAPGHVSASPVTTGFGTVQCAHGTMPVPAPATTLLLKDVPTRRGEIEGELCTPTGAALLRYFVDEFGADPIFAAHKVGYGMGTKEFAAPNCVRAFLGEANEGADSVCELQCNLDDMTPEGIGRAQQVLLDAGALDVYIVPIQMKKNRPASLLSCICTPAEAERFSVLMLRHTSTAGVRRINCERRKLMTGKFAVETVYGAVRIKTYEGYGVKKIKPEYDDIAAICEKHGNIPFDVVYHAAVEEAERQG